MQLWARIVHLCLQLEQNASKKIIIESGFKPINNIQDVFQFTAVSDWKTKTI